jgi:hypothetical protein
MAYVMKSCDFVNGGISKKGNLMDYVSRSKITRKIQKNSKKLPKKEILMDYISRSCDFLKAKMGRWLM